MTSPFNVPQIISDQDVVFRTERYSIIQTGVGTFNLRLQSVEFSDNGTYTCLVPDVITPCNLGNSDYSSSFELIVNGMFYSARIVLVKKSIPNIFQYSLHLYNTQSFQLGHK